MKSFVQIQLKASILNADFQGSMFFPVGKFARNTEPVILRAAKGNYKDVTYLQILII